MYGQMLSCMCVACMRNITGEFANQNVFGGETTVTPKIAPFNKNNLTMKFNYTNKVETPI